MKPASPALLALLATNRFWLADLLTINLVSGTVLRYTTADINIVSGGNTFSCGLPFDRSKASWKTGLDVSQASINIYPAPSDLVGGVPFLQAVQAGIFDGATVQVDRAYMPTMGDVSAGVVTIFAGRVGDVQAGRTSVVMPVNSYTELLNRQFPGNLYTSTCGNTLYDPRCTLIKASFSTAVAAQAGATKTAIPISNGQPVGYYDLGTVQFTSGANNGVITTIKHWDGYTLTLGIPLRNAPTAGDTMVIAPGCDHTPATCLAKFSNFQNFRGYPYVPTPETAI
jgi:uncharacterized phage protein (TIGR02218 family)